MPSRPIGPLVTGLVRRTSWLMLGAAIGLAAVLLAVSVAQLLGLVLPGPSWPLTAGCVAATVLLGLLPGIRELEITATRSLLGVEAPLLLPERARAAHRVRTVGWVAVHLGSGLAVAVLIFAGLPGSVAVFFAALSGTAIELLGFAVPTDQAALRLGVGVAAVICFAAVPVATWATGQGVRRLALWFLGPTWRDQWELAEARLAAEATHTRLARELHDGIGHALTIISVQATAARRAPQTETDRGLQVIEQTAREALDDLDSVLSVLRHDEPATRSPAPDLASLPALLDRHRAAGMRIEADVDADLSARSQLPAPLSRLAYRAVAEGLTNAERYGADEPVTVTVRGGAELAVRVLNTVGRNARAVERRGHGLADLGAQVRLVGGRFDAGSGLNGQWQLAVSMPLGRRRG